MAQGTYGAGRYQSLRRTGHVLSRMAPLVSFGLWAVGLGLFLDQSRDLISDAQFTWGERRVMAAIAVVTGGSWLLAGWVVAKLFRAAADMIDVLADLGDSSQRTGDLLERHVIPLLGRIATDLERNSPLQEGANFANPQRMDSMPASRRRDPNTGPAGR